MTIILLVKNNNYTFLEVILQSKLASHGKFLEKISTDFFRNAVFNLNKPNHFQKTKVIIYFFINEQSD